MPTNAVQSHVSRSHGSPESTRKLPVLRSGHENWDGRPHVYPLLLDKQVTLEQMTLINSGGLRPVF